MKNKISPFGEIFFCACAIIKYSMSVVIGIIVGLLILMLLVTGHEFGHFIMARRNGVKVEEFGICFPPRAVAWRKVDGKWRRLKKSEWKNPPGEGLVFSLNWLPIGGFCQMMGESDADRREGSFGAATFWQKTKILFGGVAMNWLMAFVILTILAWVGMPHFIENQFEIEGDSHVVALQPVTIGEIKEGSPADKAGLKTDDVIMWMEADEDRADVVVPDDVLKFDRKHAGKEVTVGYKRGDDELSTKVTLNETDAEYILGAGIGGSAVFRSTWSAPIVGFGTMMQITGETFKGIGQLVVNVVGGAFQTINVFDQSARDSGAAALKSAGDSVSGPVGIIGVLFPNMLSSGPSNLMFFTALISISLACMNVLPIPALDGGRWMLISIFKLRKKKLTKEREEKIVGRAFMVLLGIIVIVTILDIVRLIK